MKRLSILLGLFALSATPIAGVAQTPTPEIEVEQPWARASAGRTTNGVAYVTLKNTGTGADRLVAGASPVAERVEFHMHFHDDGVVRMRQVDAIDVRPGELVVLRPGGLHVMLIGLDEPLREGERFPLTLTFERTGDVTVDVAVKRAGASGPRSQQDDHDDGS